MAKESKRFNQIQGLVDEENFYDLKEALDIVKQTAKAKFDETVELAVRLGVDPRHADQQVRSTVILPSGTGKEVRVIVFAKGEKVNEAIEAGAIEAGAAELIEKVSKGFLDFDVTVATPDMMKDVSKLGRVLGPRGLMPNPKAGTVTFEVGKAISDLKKGKIEFRADKFGIVHAPIGKASFSIEDLYENLKTLILAVLKARPAAAKGQYVKSITLAATMGPGIKIDPKLATKVTEES